LNIIHGEWLRASALTAIRSSAAGLLGAPLARQTLKRFVLCCDDLAAAGDVASQAEEIDTSVDAAPAMFATSVATMRTVLPAMPSGQRAAASSNRH